MARGWLAQISTQPDIATRLGYGDEDTCPTGPPDRTFARLNAPIRSPDASRSVREPVAPYESQISNPQSHAR